MDVFRRALGFEARKAAGRSEMSTGRAMMSVVADLHVGCRGRWQSKRVCLRMLWFEL